MSRTTVDPIYESFRKMAREHQQRFGLLQRVQYLSHYPKFEIQFEFEKALRLSRQRTGKYDFHFMSLGYYGEGPRCAQAFLEELGFAMTEDEIAAIKPGAVITREGDQVVVAYPEGLQESGGNSLWSRVVDILDAPENKKYVIGTAILIIIIGFLLLLLGDLYW